ncbi:MAG: hypothetical protein K2M87_01180 [Muribaculaceae bacterium]|nr:hypothetical protein [Muribaculaceae bacterium]
MTKFRFKSLGKSLALAAIGALTVAPAAQAEVFMNEDFSTYTLGGLYNQNGWIHHTTQTIQNDPIQIVEKEMTYPGFCNASKAATISIGTQTNQEKLKKQFRDKTDSQEPVYYAVLVNLSEVPTNTKASYFLSFMTANANADAGLIDQKGGNEYGRLFAYQSPADANKVRFGLSKNGATIGAKLETRDFDLNETVLLICKWEYVDGTTNDIYKVWVNPVKSDSEPEADLQHSSGADPTLGEGKLPIQGFEIRQGKTSSKETPSGFVGPVKVASSWAELWSSEVGPGPDPVVTPKMSVNVSKVEFPPVFQGGNDLTKTVVVKAENLSEDITVSGLTTVVPSVTTISKDDAMSAGGYTLTLTLPLSEPAAVSETLTLSSEGANTVNIPVTGNVVAVIAKSALSELNNLPESDYNVYRYTGEAVVTFVDNTNEVVYAQDATGGIKIGLGDYYGSQTLKRGDMITDMICASDASVYGGGAVYPCDNVIATVVSENNEVEPLQISLEQLSANRQAYMSRVVKVADLTFTAYSEGAKIGTAQTPVSSGSATGAVRAFPGSAALNLPMPQKATAVTGISTSKTASVISMRDANAIDLGAAELNVETEKVYDDEYAAIGTSTVHSRFTVSAVNLQKPVSIWLGGAGRNAFSLDVEEIPAGTSTTVVTVNYVPTTTGKHTAMINFDASPSELSSSYSISAKAWDPANPPVVTVDDSALVEFSAKPGETSEQTITYTSTNLLDWGSVRVASTEGSAFRINTTTLLKNGQGQIKVTFAPQTEGNFAEQLIFSADKMEPVTVNLSGKCAGEQEEEQKQGDELVYDITNPRKLVVENFDNCGEHNKPLAIDGWKNVAVKGTRAWWAYTFADDNNTAAKVTPYDSKLTEGEECEMMLLSPALDFANAETHLLTFSIMGDFLTGDATDVLDVCYIDYYNGETYIEPLQGLNIPSTSDYNKEWIPYVINLEGQDLPDVFFIGFRYKSTRGVDHSATYYVDDFSWGSTQVPYIHTSVTEHNFDSEAETRYESEEIIIRPQALTSDISLSISGTHADKFDVDPKLLPSEGGAVKVSFLSPEVGVHEALLKLSSQGAPDSFISLKANNTAPSGVEVIDGDLFETADVFNLQGVRVATQVTLHEAVRTLPAGIYIFGDKKIVVR